jgi:hypothetical protein
VIGDRLEVDLVEQLSRLCDLYIAAAWVFRMSCWFFVGHGFATAR